MQRWSVIRHPLILPAIVLAALAAFAPFLGGGLLTDDFVHVERIVRDGGGLAGLVAAPDAFGFHRPVTQASLALDALVNGGTPAAFRVTNLALHAGVVGASFIVARLILSASLAAWLATLAFALTPKAHPIAVLWISARADLLMALFSLIATAAWIVWTRRGAARWGWLVAAAYVLALLSKETALLLPVMLLATPQAARPFQERAGAAAGMIAATAPMLWWRMQVGALMPLSADAHYNLVTPVFGWIRNGTNCFFRMLPSPLALFGLVGLPALATRSAPRGGSGGDGGLHLGPVLIFGALWTLVFLLPALPIEARSELYLYLPTFGICLVAGYLVERWINTTAPRRAVAIGLAVYVLALGTYQVSRSLAIHRDLVFSARLVDALATSAILENRETPVTLVPADAETRRFLQDAIGGYLDVVMRHALGPQRYSASVEYQGGVDESVGLRLLCRYGENRLILRRLGA